MWIPFFIVVILKKVRESKDRVFYKKLKKRAYIFILALCFVPMCRLMKRICLYVQSGLYTAMPTAYNKLHCMNNSSIRFKLKWLIKLRKKNQEKNNKNKRFQNAWITYWKHLYLFYWPYMKVCYALFSVEDLLFSQVTICISLWALNVIKHLEENF